MSDSHFQLSPELSLLGKMFLFADVLFVHPVCYVALNNSLCIGVQLLFNQGILGETLDDVPFLQHLSGRSLRKSDEGSHSGLCMVGELCP